MGESVIRRKKGDTFQAMFFWYQARKIFDPTSGVYKNVLDDFENRLISKSYSLR